MTDDEVLRRAIAHYFAPGRQQRALALLQSYGEQPHERELARVRFDLVALSRGDVDELERLLAVARRDYRAVVERAERRKDPIIGDFPRAKLLGALDLREDAPGAGAVDLGN